jgi:hypothetical protein
MTAIIPGRFTAKVETPVVLFLIGMRFNHWHKVSKWWPVATAMPRMLAELERKPEAGFLWARTYWSGRLLLTQQYWRSFEHLLAYADDKNAAHFPAWRAFRKSVGDDGAVGIWHETYLIKPGGYECIYGNMPLFGLAAATTQVPATGRMAQAKERFAAE